MTSSTSTPAGWYADPQNPQLQRLYDGVEWTDQTRPVPGPFSAKYAHRTAGIWLLVLGILFALGLPGTIGGLITAGSGAQLGGAAAGFVFFLVVAGGLIAWSVYLLRGRGENPALAAERAQLRVAAERDFHAAVDNLAARPTGAEAVVAMRHVDAMAERAYGTAGPERAAAAIAGLGIDRASFDSPRLGALAVWGTDDWLEIYFDWIICGYQAFDVDRHTKMSVYLDGAVQVVARQVQQGNQMVTQNEHVDLRQANVQVVSDLWSIGGPIHPDDVNEARRIADQLDRHVAKLQPQAASAADIRAMVDAIISANGQPIAEKLKQLSNLRYDRVLSDEDFELAKSKLLANPGSAY